MDCIDNDCMGWSDVDSVNSISEIDRPATGCASGTGRLQFDIGLARFGSKTKDISEFNIGLNSGDQITIIGKSITNTGDAFASLQWKEIQ